MAELSIRLRLSPGAARWAIAGLCLGLMGTQVNPESVTLNTYYPAPSGVYVNMITTGNTYLARDPGGLVGIGTTSPQALLDVNGAVRVGNYSSAPAGGIGSIYYDTSKHSFDGNYDPSAPSPGWQPIGGIAGCQIKNSASGCTNWEVSPSCPAGTHLTGGGCYGADRLLVDAPSGSTAWQCNQFGSDCSLTAYAICCQ